MKLLWLLMTQTILLTSAQYHEISSKPFLPPDDDMPNKNDSLFGYSFAYLSNNRSLIISAPRADSIGRLYSCSIDFRNCTTIKNEIKRETSQYDHDYWLGASVKANSHSFVTCAPRYVEWEKSYGLFGEFGHCYKSSAEGALNQLSQMPTKDRRIHTNLFQETMDSFGWSIDMGKDDIVIGGPAMFTGRVMNIRKTTVYSATGLEPDVNVRFNLGYSVVTGFLIKPRTSLHVVGSPYGDDGRGMVVFFGPDFSFFKSVKGGTVGSMFGAVLAIAQISGKLSDLLVGAPTYANEKTYDNGAVYYYDTKSLKARSTKHVKIIVGPKSGALFGSAIVSVGDLNGDGKDEVAIAAPYEDDGRGAVYLYCGTYFQATSSDQSWLQRIQPESYRTFGLSLSALNDYDENGCNELAVGAPDNNTVVLYRCMASVIVDVFAKFPNLQDRRNETHPYPDRNETYFIFKSCMNVTYPNKLKEIIAKIEVIVEIVHSHAKLASPHEDGKYNVSLNTMQAQYCEDVGVFMPKHGNYDENIMYKIEARLLESPIVRTEFDARRVILSDRSKLKDSNYVRAAECKDKNGCMPKLDLNIWCEKTHMLASEVPVVVNLSVTNAGEIAYESCVTVRLDGAPVKKIALYCQYTSLDNELKCVPNFALQTNKTWVIEDIVLDTKGLTNKNKEVVIKVMLFDHCRDVTKFKEYSETIHLTATSDSIFIKGDTNIGDEVMITTYEVSTTGKQFQHYYTITSNNLPNWEDVRCELTIPNLPYINIAEDIVVVEGSSEYFKCKVTESEDKNHKIANCILNSITQGITTYIYVYMEVPPNTLGDIIYDQNVTVSSSIKLYFEDGIKTESVDTKIVLRDINTPWWIILLATLIGLIILLIIVLILRQYGFLKRQEKRKLEDLRKSVRRQTVRRSTMQQQTEDRRRLTGGSVEAEIVAPTSSTLDKRMEVDDA